MLRRYAPGFALLATLLILVGCDSNEPASILEPEPDVQPPEPVTLTFSGWTDLQVNDLVMGLGNNGARVWGSYEPDASGPFRGTSSFDALFFSSLWIAGESDGAMRAAYSIESGNYIPRPAPAPQGAMAVTADSLAAGVTNWPSNYGAPVDANGDPTLYGDGMLWHTYEAGPHRDFFEGESIPGLRIGQSVYGYDAPGLQSALFVRFDIANSSSSTWADFRTGFRADIDLPTGRDNVLAYDAQRGLSYVFEGSEPTGGVPAFASGFAILEGPSGSTGPEETVAHRITYKSDPARWSRPFSDITLDGTQAVLNVLSGLDNYGDAFVDPATDDGTPFQFATTAPLGDAPWVSIPYDVRSVLGAVPATWAPGETHTLTVVWVVGEGATRAEAIASVRSQVDGIRAQPEKWRF